MSAEGAPRLLERILLDALPELFVRNSDRWRPQAVHRAKSLGQTQVAYQLDFVDLGLVPAIEHEVEEKLDRLLEQVIGRLLRDDGGEREDAAFRTTSASWRRRFCWIGNILPLHIGQMLPLRTSWRESSPTTIWTECRVRQREICQRRPSHMLGAYCEAPSASGIFRQIA